MITAGYWRQMGHEYQLFHTLVGTTTKSVHIFHRKLLFLNEYLAQILIKCYIEEEFDHQ